MEESSEWLHPHLPTFWNLTNFILFQKLPFTQSLPVPLKFTLSPVASTVTLLGAALGEAELVPVPKMKELALTSNKFKDLGEKKTKTHFPSIPFHCMASMIVILQMRLLGRV